MFIEWNTNITNIKFNVEFAADLSHIGWTLSLFFQFLLRMVHKICAETTGNVSAREKRKIFLI